MNYTYDAPDNEIYCRPCLRKAFPEAETPLIHSDTSVIKPNGEDGGCPRCGGAVFQVMNPLCTNITIIQAKGQS